MIGLTYGSADSLNMAADIMREICHTAYSASRLTGGLQRSVT